MPELIIYGGAFDPPHQGHVDCVRAATESFPEAEIWVMPAKQPAGAGGKHKQPALAFNERIRLCELAFEPLNEGLEGKSKSGSKRISISSLEESLPQPNFTIRTLAWIGSHYPIGRPALLLGQDQLTAFDRWRGPEQILQLADLIVVSRSPEGGSSVSIRVDAEAMLSRLPGGYSRLGGEVFEVEGDSGKVQRLMLPNLNTTLYFIEATLCPASSSEIRDALQNDLSTVREGWLPSPVMQYIKDHKLYETERTIK